MRGGVLGIVKKYPKKKCKKETQNGKTTETVVENETISDFMKQVEKNKKIQEEANMMYQNSTKQITSRQKCIIVELEILKNMMFQKLKILNEEVQNLKKISQGKMVPEWMSKQQKLHQKQEISHLQNLFIFQHNRIKQARCIFMTVKARYQLLEHSARSESYQQKTITLSQQLHLVENECAILQRQTVKMNEQNKRVFEEKKENNNELQEQKGNIRVYCRLRPAQHQRIDYQISENMIRLKRDKNILKSKNRVDEYEYLFERIFTEDTPQDAVFEQLAELIQCTVDGKNVCIFAYGQTGSGKTHTMAGNLESSKHQMRGFIPRSIEYIFDQIKIAQSNNYKPSISISICEIYNDKIYDLLSSKQKVSGSAFKLNNTTHKKLNEEKSLETLVNIFVKSPEQAMHSLINALKGRTTAQTKMNAQSSRSHMIFQIKNQLFNPKTQTHRTSSLVLVDLAGSQRQKDSGVIGLRLQEAKSINNSLTELGKVMRAIKDNERPTFRNCKLTMILQKYLQSEGKAVMFVNVSPDKKDLDQTVNSLVFAQSVRECKLKKASSKNADHWQSD